MKNKVCSKCQIDLPRSEFFKLKASSDGLQSRCKKCHMEGRAEYCRQRYAADADFRTKSLNQAKLRYQKVKDSSEFKDHKKKYSRKRYYGITDEQYQALLTKQDNKCAICRSENKLSVDHNHITKQIRGLICLKCNTAIGFLQADSGPTLLMEALNYIKENKNESGSPKVPGT